MPPKGLTDEFFNPLFQLLNWEYTDATFNEKKLEIRGLVDKFIFQPLSEENKQFITRKAKANRFPVPPPLNYLVQFDFIKDQIAIVLELVKDIKSFEELYSKFDSDSDYTINKFNQALSEVVTAKKNS